MLLHRRLEGIAVQHPEHFALVRYLHGRRIVIPIARYHVLSGPLGRNHKFLSQLTGAEQHYLLHFSELYVP